MLLKPKFFVINALEATHKSPINDKLILKEVKAALLLDKVTKDYKSLLSQVLENSKNPYKTRTLRTDYSCTKRRYISLKV